MNDLRTWSPNGSSSNTQEWWYVRSKQTLMIRIFWQTNEVKTDRPKGIWKGQPGNLLIHQLGICICKRVSYTRCMPRHGASREQTRTYITDNDIRVRSNAARRYIDVRVEVMYSFVCTHGVFAANITVSRWHFCLSGKLLLLLRRSTFFTEYSKGHTHQKALWTHKVWAVQYSPCYVTPLIPALKATSVKVYNTSPHYET